LSPPSRSNKARKKSGNAACPQNSISELNLSLLNTRGHVDALSRTRLACARTFKVSINPGTIFLESQALRRIPPSFQLPRSYPNVYHSFFLIPCNLNMSKSQGCGTCPSCFQETLTAERRCEGNGAKITNWDRRYQRVRVEFSLSIYSSHIAQCTACQLWLWHDPETSLEDIPEHIKVSSYMFSLCIYYGHPFISQVKFALKESLAMQPKLHLECANANCLTKGNKPRQANKNCGRTPAECSDCCRKKGGCPVHKELHHTSTSFISRKS
jgi:hypothetical protein